MLTTFRARKLQVSFLPLPGLYFPLPDPICVRFNFVEPPPCKRFKTLPSTDDVNRIISDLIPASNFEGKAIAFKTWKTKPYTTSQKHTSSIDLLIDRLPGSGKDGLALLSDIFSSHTQDFGILAAPSGSGKTRAVLEHLSLNWGLYFVTTTEGNGGSEDFSHVIGAIMKQCRDAPDIDGEVVVWNKCSKLVYVRLLILSRLLSVKPDLTPFEWLVLQLYPNNYFGKDVFSLASSNVLELDVGPDEIQPLNMSIEFQIKRKIFCFCG